MSDAVANFAYSLASGGTILGSNTGTNLIVNAGDGTLFPTPPFNIVIWPSGTYASAANAEIMRVTAISGDSFTVVRAQENTTALSVITTGYQVQQGNTAKLFNDM